MFAKGLSIINAIIIAIGIVLIFFGRPTGFTSIS